ncbi:hypothetical protein K1T71_005643 [Dendrolimus kikuchii]|uniref:Uncharacterized protein n=1 Tax=Dendrolimus kikuchii TaxID=765133 RepID=A0ACC1D4M1_9NEOP|nr:hypothetical protein K1T71_005643 [Dendrolimus kikuchii]
MVHTTCAVRDCKSSSRLNKNLRFHQFPHTEDRCKRWIEACRRRDLVGKTCDNLKYTYLCNLHFEKHMYGKKTLKKMAVPTLLLPSKNTRSIHTQTDLNMNVLNKIIPDLTTISKAIESRNHIDKSSQTNPKFTGCTPRKRKLNIKFIANKKLKLRDEN